MSEHHEQGSFTQSRQKLDHGSHEQPRKRARTTCMNPAVASNWDMGMMHGPSIAGDRGAGARSLMMHMKEKQDDTEKKKHRKRSYMRPKLVESESSIFQGICVYFSGYTGEVSALQLAHIVEVNGGRVTAMPGPGCTHVVGENVSGSRAQKSLQKKKKTPLFYVRAAWIHDSVSNGKKMDEFKYNPIKQGTTMDKYLR